MAINEAASKRTVHFEFEEENVKYYMRFHYTEQFGDTISISEDGESWASLPCKLFEDTVDFLRSKGYVSGKIAGVISNPNQALVNKTVPLTKINKPSNAVNIPLPKSPYDPDSTKVEKISQVDAILNPGVYGIPESVLSSELIKEVEPEGKQENKKVEELMKQEVTPEMLKERAAKVKAKEAVSKKKIKRANKDE